MFSLVLNLIQNLIEKINTFLFKNKSFEQLALTRIVLCGTLFFLACSRQLNMDQYGLDSIIPREKALSIYPEFYRPLFQYFFWPDTWAPVVHGFLIVLLLLATLGLSNRFLMLITWVISQGFINRNYSMLFGADLIGALFLFYLSFTLCHERYSFKTFFFKKHQVDQSNEENFSSLVSSVFFRLMQFQIAVIYMYTGFEKLKGSTWWDGTALWTVFANPQFVSYDFIFLRNFPLFFTMGTFITLIFEIYFPAMILFKPARTIFLCLGVFFHTMIGVLLSLMPFSMIMISTYFLFLDQDDVKKIVKGFKIWGSKLSHIKTI